MRQYQIIQKGKGNYFPQVRELIPVKIFKITIYRKWTAWKRIGDHVYGFGLYDYLDHPKSFHDANKIIHDYEEQFMNPEKEEVVLTTIKNDYEVQYSINKSKNKKPVFNIPEALLKKKQYFMKVEIISINCNSNCSR